MAMWGSGKVQAEDGGLVLEKWPGTKVDGRASSLHSLSWRYFVIVKENVFEIDLMPDGAVLSRVTKAL